MTVQDPMSWFDNFAFGGHYDDWLHTHSMALQACAEDRLGAAVMTRNLSFLRMTGVRIPSGIDVARAFAVFTELGEPHGEVDMLGMVAFAHRHRGAVAESIAAGDAAMAKAEAIGYDLGQCRLWYLRAITDREQGRHAEAAVAAWKCLELAKQLGTAHDRTLALWEVAGACQGDDAAVRAMVQLRSGLELCQHRGERLLAAYLQLAVGDLCQRFGLGDPRTAIAQALPVFVRHNVLLGQAIGLRLLGGLDHQAGTAHLTRAVRLAEKLGNRREKALALKALGAAYLSTGAPIVALETWQEALAIFESVHDHFEADAVRTLLLEPMPTLS